MEHMRWLTLRLSNNQSIGPKVLMDLWANACETNQSSVTRETLPGKSTSYALHAPTSLAYPKRAELRMRKLLEEAGYTAGTAAGPLPLTPFTGAAFIPNTWCRNRAFSRGGRRPRCGP